MNKPNVSPDSVAADFTELQSLLKNVHEVLDRIQSRPYIPSIRQDTLAFMSDKVNNLQDNFHSLQMQLSHLG